MNNSFTADSLEDLPEQTRGPYGVPVGTVNVFSGSATPMETASSKSWTDNVGASTSAGADPTTEDDDDSGSGHGLTSLLNPVYPG